MTEEKHTPWDYRFDESKGGAAIFLGDCIVCSTYGFFSEENAKLIVAAPELLDVLAKLCTAVEKATPIIYKHNEPLFQEIDAFLYQAAEVFSKIKGES